MENYSQTQLANFTIIAGIVVFLAKQFGLDLGQDEALTIIAGLFTVGGVIYSIYNRYKKGDVAISGRRLNK